MARYGVPGGGVQAGTPISTTTVPGRVPPLIATEKSYVPACPGAGAKVSSPVPRLNVMFAGSGWGVIV